MYYTNINREICCLYHQFSYELFSSFPGLDIYSSFCFFHTVFVICDEAIVPFHIVVSPSYEALSIYH